MKRNDVIDEHDDQLDDDEPEDLEDEAEEPAAGDGEDGGGADGDGEDAEEGEASLDELVAKKEQAKPAEEEDEDESMLTLSREERLEPLAVKVVPPQTNEFVCKKCYLVKHRSQLADKTRMLCRDCA